MKKISILLVMIMAAFAVNAQVAINKDGSAPDASSILHVKGSGGDDFFIDDANGYVGLGTTNPNYPLHINGGGSFTYLQITNNATGSASNNGILFGVDSNTDAVFYMGGNHNMRFMTNSHEWLRITGIGYVGVGTTSPSEKLEVAGNTKVIGDITANADITADGDVTANGDLWGTNGYLTDNLEIGGNVAINTSIASAQKLAIDGGSGIGINVENSSATYGALRLENNGGGPSIFIWNGDIELRNGSSVDINGTGEVNRAAQSDADLVPIAYGVVKPDGTIYNSGTGNWTSTWNNTGHYYEITISGESFYIGDYIVSATNIGTPSMSVSYGSASGKLLIYPKNSSGSTVQDNFSFIVYKP